MNVDPNNQEEVIEFLNSMKWPKPRSSYCMSDEKGLPPYRILAKMLKEKNIIQQMTWNKEQCIEALGGIDSVNAYIKESHILEADLISLNLSNSCLRELETQRSLSSLIQQRLEGTSGIVSDFVKNEEISHIDQQQQMFS